MGDMARFQEELAKAGALLDGSGCTQLEGLAGPLLTQLQSGALHIGSTEPESGIQSPPRWVCHRGVSLGT
jgi:hypothetical protein